MVTQDLAWIAPAAGALSLISASLLASRIRKQGVGTPRMQEIAKAIREGARAFLTREYRALAIFIVIVAVVLAVTYRSSPRSHGLVAVSFLVGALCSGLSGWFGMRIATLTNVRTTDAAKSSLSPFLVAFRGGAVIGLAVVGLGLLGLGGLFLIYPRLDVFRGPEGSTDLPRVLTVLAGFSLGASSIALFARVGGGIFTKAADIAADSVGKLEKGIPEDDPRNPAVIADNVGDNVGDVAGMGANLFESQVGAIVAAMIIGSTLSAHEVLPAILLPLLLSSFGVLTSLLGILLVRVGRQDRPFRALNRGTLGATVLTLIGAWFVVEWLLPGTRVFQAVACGLLAGTLIGRVTQYDCAKEGRPVRQIVKGSSVGAATNVLTGVAVGMRSTGIPVSILAVTVLVAYLSAGLYGIALAAVGMLSTTGIQLALFAFGPIADNAGGIAQMSGLPKEVRACTDELDAVGNTTAAIGRGFAIGSAALTSLALFAAFQSQVGLRAIDVLEPNVMAGLFVGAMLPFVFSSMALRAVGRAAATMIEEVRRQFREIPGLMSGEGRPDYVRCVDLSTRASLREMVLPGVLALAAPLVAGFIDRTGGTLGGLLAGALASGVPLAIFLSNSGSAWDNAKKRIEDGDCGGRGSDAHKAAVIGDTVGDPFKDTAGPSLNILVKLLSVVALLIAPLINHWGLSLWG